MADGGEAERVVTREMSVGKNGGDSGSQGTPEQLARFGLDSGQTRCRVVEVNRKRLVMESDYARLTLRKF